MTQTTQVTQSPVIPQGVDDDYHDVEVAHMNNDPLSYSVIKDCCSFQCALGKSTTRTKLKRSAKRVKTSKNLDLERQVITEFIWNPLLEIEVYFHKGVILFYLEVGVGWMNDFQRYLARA